MKPHSFDFGRWNRGMLSYHIIFKERAGQTWSALLTNIKGIVGIPDRETLLITYKLHGTNILLRETRFEAFGNWRRNYTFFKCHHRAIHPLFLLYQNKQPPKPLQDIYSHVILQLFPTNTDIQTNTFISVFVSNKYNFSS